MMIWAGWLLLLPFAGGWWLCYKIVDANKKGKSDRLLGVLVSLIVGASSIFAGYFIGPIVGWFIMAVGVLVLATGTWRSMVEPELTESEMEQKWLRELSNNRQQLGTADKQKLDNMWISAKEEAKTMLQQGDVDDYFRIGEVRNILMHHYSRYPQNRTEFETLYAELGQLEWKSIIKEANRILGNDNVENYGKKERERFNWICYELSRNRHRPQAKELSIQLEELNHNVTRNKKR